MRWGLVVQQPYAQFIAEGWKWTETRGFVPRTTLQPGDDLVIIAGQRNICGRPRAGEHWSDPIAGWRMRRVVKGGPHGRRGTDTTELVRLPDLERIRLSFGAAICVVRYTGALEVVRSEVADADATQVHMTTNADGTRRLWVATTKNCAVARDDCREISDQLPMGIWEHRRKAWTFEAPRKLAHPLVMTREASTSRHMQGVFELTPAAQQWVAAELEAA